MMFIVKSLAFLVLIDISAGCLFALMWRHKHQQRKRELDRIEREYEEFVARWTGDPIPKEELDALNSERWMGD